LFFAGGQCRDNFHDFRDGDGTSDSFYADGYGDRELRHGFECRQQ
jgi:hypothetical protein